MLRSVTNNNERTSEPGYIQITRNILFVFHYLKMRPNICNLIQHKAEHIVERRAEQR